MTNVKNSHQIRILQEGTDLYAIDIIDWPEEVFKHPIVYTAIAVDADSYNANQIGSPFWKWIPIRRTQFAWLINHSSCMVSYIANTEEHRFYCYHHQCWEKEGRDSQVINIAEFRYLCPDLFEERDI
jgi:hypothetical protein